MTVSVCIPVHNGREHLPACLDSLLCQRGVQLEIVVRDDGSKDGSLELVQEFARLRAGDHPHVTWNVAANPNPGGMVANWNECLRAANGEFVKMMGQDDVLYPDCLAVQVRAFQDFQRPRCASRRLIFYRQAAGGC
jgi:glycosyltransferase involved in cell wall biosynthesis